MSASQTSRGDDHVVPNAPVVMLRRATKKYETGSKHVIALEQVDLDLVAGELIVVLGPSRCGKTTLRPAE